MLFLPDSILVTAGDSFKVYLPRLITCIARQGLLKNSVPQFTSLFSVTQQSNNIHVSTLPFTMFIRVDGAFVDYPRQFT